MGNVIKFKLKSRASREQAMSYLKQHYFEFPDIFPFSHDIFHGWRFINALDGNVYFADFISRGITEDEFFDSLLE